ncbi:MAG: TolB-like protein [Rhodoglobus sp.]|nr:TolB-like protein [Rhodoglobus sp.]
MPVRSRPFGLRVLAVVALSGCVALASAAPALAVLPASGETQLVSVNLLGTSGGSADASTAQVSADGRYVAFSTLDSDVVLLDGNPGNYDVFRRDLVTGQTITISSSSLGFPANAGAGQPSISGDGRYVVFSSTATNLVPEDTSTDDDIFLRDTVLATTTLVSVNTAGTAGGNDYSTNPSISADGSTVTFASPATDLVPTDNNGHIDVFYRTVGAAVPSTGLVSVSTALLQADDDSGYSESPMSADGRYVVFDSFATNLTSGASLEQVYRRDIQSGDTILVSANAAGTGTANGFSTYQSVSADGSMVAFSSDATDLAAGDAAGVDDVFVRSVTTGVTALVSVPRSSGGGTLRDAYRPSISGDGRFVAFESDSTNLVDTPTTGNGDVYVRSLAAATTSLVSVNTAGTSGGNNGSYGVTLSGDGSIAAFASSAVDLTALDVDSHTDIFARGLDITAATPAGPAAAPALAATGTDPTPLVWIAALLAVAGALLVRRGSLSRSR